ncbi:MAG: hypothetical protein JJT78_13400 [Leptospira sp.]|nr:hypothetical protein [Leptospira sp.]
MKTKQFNTISKLYHYKLILDYEGTTYPMEILYALDGSVVLKTFDNFQKFWTDRISGLLVHTKDALMQTVSGRILGIRPLTKKGEDLDFEAKEWLLEVEVDNYEEIPSEWIAFSLAEEN